MNALSIPKSRIFSAVRASRSNPGFKPGESMPFWCAVEQYVEEPSPDQRHAPLRPQPAMSGFDRGVEVSLRR